MVRGAGEDSLRMFSRDGWRLSFQRSRRWSSLLMLLRESSRGRGGGRSVERCVKGNADR